MDCIKIWSFNDAPKAFQKLSGHDGDEDCVILIDADDYDNNYKTQSIVDRLAVCARERYEINLDLERTYIFITAHA